MSLTIHYDPESWFSQLDKKWHCLVCIEDKTSEDTSVWLEVEGYRNDETETWFHWRTEINSIATKWMGTTVMISNCVRVNAAVWSESIANAMESSYQKEIAE